MDKRGPYSFLCLTLVGLVLGALGLISIPLGHGISGFWVAGVIQVAGGIWFGGWGVLAAAVFPSVSSALTHTPLVSILGFIPANLVQALIPAWAYRHFRQDRGRAVGRGCCSTWPGGPWLRRWPGPCSGRPPSWCSGACQAAPTRPWS